MDVPASYVRPHQEETVIESSLETGQAETQWMPLRESGARPSDGDGSFDNMYQAYWQDKLKDGRPRQVVDVDETCGPRPNEASRPNDAANGQDGDAPCMCPSK